MYNHPIGSIYRLYTRYIMPAFGGYIIPTTYYQNKKKSKNYLGGTTFKLYPESYPEDGIGTCPITGMGLDSYIIASHRPSTEVNLPDKTKVAFHSIKYSSCLSMVYSVGFSGTPNNGTPYPYYSHTTPIRIPKDMGTRSILEVSSLFYVSTLCFAQ